MKRLILATGLFAAIACSGLQAQTMNMRANIPFDFRVGTDVLPSGDYLIQHKDGGVLFIVAERGKASVIALTTGTGHPDTPVGNKYDY